MLNLDIVHKADCKNNKTNSSTVLFIFYGRQLEPLRCRRVPNPL